MKQDSLTLKRGTENIEFDEWLVIGRVKGALEGGHIIDTNDISLRYVLAGIASLLDDSRVDPELFFTLLLDMVDKKESAEADHS